MRIFLNQNKIISDFVDLKIVFYLSNEKREKIYTLEDKLKKSFIPMIEEKTKIEILEQKIDSWNFVPTGIRIEIEL